MNIENTKSLNDRSLALIIAALLIVAFIINFLWQTINYLNEFGSFSGDGHGGMMLIFGYYGLSIFQFFLTLLALLNLKKTIFNSRILSFLTFNILQFILISIAYVIEEQTLVLLLYPYMISIIIVSSVFLIWSEKYRKNWTQYN